MITASHNPAKFNGIKIKNAQGGAASKDITNTVESYLGQVPVKSLNCPSAVDQGLIVVHDFKKKYVEFIRAYLNLKKMKTAKFRVLADIMHGSGRDLMRQILEGTNIRLTLMREDVNPGFDGSKPEPIPECLQVMMHRMKKEKFDFGHVLDGDADRIAAVMPGGEFVSPQKILGLLVLHLVRNRKVEGGIVKTLCGTTMMDNIAKKLGRKLYETPVGFKYISDLMVSEKIVAGGEEARDCFIIDAGLKDVTAQLLLVQTSMRSWHSSYSARITDSASSSLPHSRKPIYECGFEALIGALDGLITWAKGSNSASSKGRREAKKILDWTRALWIDAVAENKRVKQAGVVIKAGSAELPAAEAETASAEVLEAAPISDIVQCPNAWCGAYLVPGALDAHMAECNEAVPA